MTSPITIITGAGAGIGRATAHELSHHGHTLILVGRQLSTLQQTAAQLKNAHPHVADITNLADVDKLIQTTLAQFHRIDNIINNAGLAPVLSVQEMSHEQWHAVIDTNLSAAFYLSKAAWPTFKKQNNGAIVNISSLAARDPFPGFAAYGAAKAGLNLFSLSLAREGEKIGLRVYTIAPGAVETPMFRQIMTIEQVPTSKTLAPADVAKVIAQCLTGDLKYTTGEVIWLHRTTT